MKYLISLIIPLILISCQDIPEKYKTPEGQKILEKYKKQYVKGVVLLGKKLQEKVPEGEIRYSHSSLK